MRYGNADEGGSGVTILELHCRGGFSRRRPRSADAAVRYTEGCDHVETVGGVARAARRGASAPGQAGARPDVADLHIGHAVVLRKLQQFVEGGHDVTLVIGSFTARIGDPSGRNALRPRLTDEQIDANMRTYAEQAGKVLDLERVSLRYNGEWLAPLSFEHVIRLLAQTTVARMLDRKDFAARFAAGSADLAARVSVPGRAGVR